MSYELVTFLMYVATTIGVLVWVHGSSQADIARNPSTSVWIAVRIAFVYALFYLIVTILKLNIFVAITICLGLFVTDPGLLLLAVSVDWIVAYWRLGTGGAPEEEAAKVCCP